MPRPACPKCGERQCSRRKREGLFQRFFLSRLGWFPWQCSSCRKIFLVKERGKSKRRPSAGDRVIGSSHQPLQSSFSHEEESFHDELSDE
jgi:predicted RNA-binding Zn-ribbon protein involved in translation (DUF1610 family)